MTGQTEQTGGLRHASMSADPSRRELARTVGVPGALAIMMGVMVGSGIFASPPGIAAATQNAGLILGAWLAGGVIALLGALTFAELASMLPQSGGIYVFLREAYGRGLAFVFGWSYMLVVKPLAAAGIAVVFTVHVRKILGVHSPEQELFPHDSKVITIAMLALLTLVNVRGVELSTRVAAVLTGLKLLALALIALLPLFVLSGGVGNWSGAAVEGAAGEAGLASFFAVLAPIMAAVMWTYDGWSDVGAIAGEVRDPGRNLLRIYVLGTLIVTVLYLAVNASYLFLIPLREMAGMETVAPAALAGVFGGGAGLVAAAIVVGSTFGSTHASIMTGARVSFQQSRDGLLFSFLGRVHPRFGTPATALWTQLMLSILAVIFVGSFEALSAGYVFSMWIFYGLAGVALFVLRVRRPEMARPFRCWGYPFVPLVFVASAVFMTVLAVRDQPVASAQYLGLMVLGVPAYLVWMRTGKRNAGAAGS